LVLRRDPLGYALGVPLITFAALLAPMITAMTVVQVRAGVEFTAGQVVGPISGFVVLAAVATWMLVAVLRHIGEEPTTSGVDATADVAPGPATRTLTATRSEP